MVPRLTSLASTTAGSICRERRAAVVRFRGDVRSGAHRGARSLQAMRNTAQQNAGPAHENVRYAPVARSICGPFDSRPPSV
ncbi:MAG: hypothetical protein C0483_14910 [Pirellula sp.]|nr:hypothetical protein [Pirellula sp.]